ncbi:bifunctional 4-hydroxy-2-oxoglutarate aldolase/2-dehydro-3-deoxy-phosphogluconate aldolase [Psychrosphaera aquimarina]|uniref:Bifunctional 4-hydroxy-2-oxoglutarate aldolase/2-dehydro-3-deoxy-phosphogluconate aldolase n=1 Tax=Psychrosphaera aquimarina TaxID=2044854 RepID=A0ABU3R272_9GAMM|nr:bifunctional 4-hydroxy-2-oxoglutarate aldolase/2-dehydro-3-deoxy-phosphogluconate aldolase [Psychrosphaera aquimarina]MDU0113776.1 bifunctional 4-hydroxy-2-oxoglutarate aldolase/2-dehydro-3-deoxy-phosphogluconate aldolase [Psychrosphaera aquimarina]
MKSISSLMAQQPLLPIIQANNVEQGVNIAKAMFAAGLTVVEVVLRTPESLQALTAIKRALPELIVGAGTVTDEDILKQAIEAGADFIVTPAISNKLLGYLVDCGVPVLPGVSNTTDILLAREFGFTEMKLFPASLSGGAPFLKAVSSIFQDVTFCPTGGITQANKQDYLSLPNVFAVGGTWVCQPEWLNTENWQAITNSCLSAIN